MHHKRGTFDRNAFFCCIQLFKGDERKVTKSQRFWFMLITVFSFSLLLGPLTSYATPEQDEGVIEKGDVTDVLDIIKDKNLLNPKARKNQNGTVKVFLDPGHGGSDPGAHS